MKTHSLFSCLVLLALLTQKLRAEEPVGIPLSELVSRITVKEKPAILAYGEVRLDGKLRALSAEETLTAQFDTTVFFLVSHLDGWLADVSSPSDAYTKAWRLVTDTTDKSGTDQLAEVKLVLAQAINARDTTAKLRLEKTADALQVQALDLEMKRQDLMVKAAEKALDDLKKKQDDLKKSLEDARKQVSRGFQELGVNFRLRLGGETFAKLKPTDLVRCLDSTKSIFLIKFNLRDTNKGNEGWLTLLKNSPVDSMACDVMLSYPSPDGHESTLAPATPFLIRIPLFRWPFWVSFAIIGSCLFVFVKNISTTEILRDPGITMLNRDAGSKSYWHQHAHPLSMARLQMSIWFFVIITAFVFLWSTTGSLAGVNATAFALMGISGGTTVISALISQKQEWQAKDRAPNSPTSGALTNWLIDLLSDEKGITIHRFQMLAWTLVLAVVFVNGVISDYAMPVFTKELLGLMGISSGVYVGFKLKEGNAEEKEADGTAVAAKKKAAKTEGGAA